MNILVFHLFSHLGLENQCFVKAPSEGSRHESHRCSDGVLHISLAPSTNNFVLLMFGPWSNRPVEPFDVNVHETSIAKHLRPFVWGLWVNTDVIASLDDQSQPCYDDTFSTCFTIINYSRKAEVLQLNETTRLETSSSRYCSSW